MTEPKTPGGRNRRIRSLQKKLNAVEHELASLIAEEDEERDEERRALATRRKLLAGFVVLERVQRRPPLIGWLRRVLAENLTRAYDRSQFGLEVDEPLIPQEEWPGWPEGPRTEPRVADSPRTRMTPGRRRARIALLQGRRKTILTELDGLLKASAPERETKNNLRRILVGAAVLAESLRKKRVHQWLRKLLDNHLTAMRDRSLFQLQDDGPLLPEEERAGLRLARRQAATRRAPDDSPPATDAVARNPRSTLQTADMSGAARSSSAGDAVHAQAPESADNEAIPDSQEPIPGWRPCRVGGTDSPHSGSRTPISEWGARLASRTALKALPEELVGRMITITDSSQHSWNTRVTEVVSRDERCVVVRNSGRPRFVGDRPEPEAAGSSST